MPSVFNNSLYLETWLTASSNKIKSQVNDLAAHYVHVALIELSRLNNHRSEVVDPIKKRKEILENLVKAAKLGNADGKFLSGLCLLEGFGCEQQDKLSGISLIYTARWLGSEIATKYLLVCNGRSFLYGNNVGQSFDKAIQCFAQAGTIAKPELALLRSHLQQQRLRLEQRASIVASRRPALVLAS